MATAVLLGERQFWEIYLDPYWDRRRIATGRGGLDAAAKRLHLLVVAMNMWTFIEMDQ